MPTTTTAPPKTSPVDLNEFFAAVLVVLGAPVTANNINNLKAWTHAENGTNFDAQGNYTGPAWNPLNIEHSFNGSSPWGPAMAKGAPVQQYKSAADGVQATAFEINSWIPQFAPINAALKSDTPCSSFGDVVVKTGWGTEPFNACGAKSSGVLGTVNGSVTDALNFAGAMIDDPKFGIELAGGTSFASVFPGVSSLAGGPSVQGSALPGQVGGPNSILNSPFAQIIGELETVLGDIISPTWWKRVGLGALGLVMIAGGIALFVATTKEGSVTDNVADVVPLAATAA